VTVKNLDGALSRMCHKALMRNAEQRTLAQESCRDWNANTEMRWGIGMLITAFTCVYFWPQVSFFILCSLAVSTLMLNTVLKLVATALHLINRSNTRQYTPVAEIDLPAVTILVPLFRERDVAGALVRRLSELDYPTDKLDVCLVLEANDATTQAALAVTQLPFWMRAIRVPIGTLQTKPRALNYALSFAKGSIIGVYDAEDADLGSRLARHGYCTEIIDTVTQEEANARTWPWVKHRSRWLKGYAITYGVHMRNPVQLWRDLGAWRFFGVQLLFGGTITQFLLAPLLWSFWLMLIGLPHPLDGVLSKPVALTFAGFFLLCEVIGIVASAIATTSAGKPELIKWTPTLHVYFPLAALAAYKGVIELATKPFYWDKTAHGVFAPTQPKPRPSPQLQPLPHPVAAV
jgi:cellulose synthase/poly-beta-1,6-N-acetylglucosamine synthase-like glycosyltransferase